MEPKRLLLYSWQPGGTEHPPATHAPQALGVPPPGGVPPVVAMAHPVVTCASGKARVSAKLQSGIPISMERERQISPHKDTIAGSTLFSKEFLYFFQANAIGMMTQK